MPREFGQIEQDIFDSSIMELPIPSRYVWNALLILAGSTTHIRMGAKAIAYRIHAPYDVVKVALKAFLSPDPMSRTSAHDGRRLELIDPANEFAGYILLNKEARTVSREADQAEALKLGNRRRQRVKRRLDKESPDVSVRIDRLEVVPGANKDQK